MKIKIEFLGYKLNIEPIKDQDIVNVENEALKDYIKKLTELLNIAQDKLLKMMYNDLQKVREEEKVTT